MSNDPQAFADMRDFIGNLDLEFTKYAKGFTPSHVTDLLRNTLGEMSADDRKFLGIVFLFSTSADKSLLNEILMIRPGMANVRRYLLSHWSIWNSINMTSMNLLGNMIVAAHKSPGTPLIESFRTKLKGHSIWHVDLNATKLSSHDKAFALKHVQRFSKSEAMRCGTIVIYMLLHGPLGAADMPPLPEHLGNFDPGTLFGRPVLTAKQEPDCEVKPIANNQRDQTNGAQVHTTTERITDGADQSLAEIRKQSPLEGRQKKRKA